MSVEAPIHMVYEYDMGDGWEHQVTLLGRASKGLPLDLCGKEAPKVLYLRGGQWE